MFHSKALFEQVSRTSGHDIKNIVVDFQGGGANVAYSIGFIIPLLKDPNIRIVGARGTSAGAMVACILGDAINSAARYEEGRLIAIDALERFLNDLVRESAPAMQAIELMNPLSWNPFAKFLFSSDSPNLPVLKTLAHCQESMHAVFGRAATHHTAAVATDTLRRLVGRAVALTPHPADCEDHVLTHAASGKFVKVHINTARVTANGLENVVHTGEALTLKSLIGSAALKGFFKPSIINGEQHIDGGYTQNGCLSVPHEETPDAHAIVIVGTNRPQDTQLIPSHEDVFRPHALKDTMGLDLHQMYRRVLGRAHKWQLGQPTIHLTTYNHCPSHDWTAKQNVSAWNIERLTRAGTADGLRALVEHRPHFGVRPTVDRYALEAIAREGRAQPRQRATGQAENPAYAA